MSDDQIKKPDVKPTDDTARGGDGEQMESNHPAAADVPVDAPADSGIQGVAPEAVARLEATAKKKRKKKDKGDGLGTSRGIETLFRSQYRVNMDLSALADTKSNIMISINGIIISIILASISPKIDANPFLLTPTVILLLGCLGSMVFAVLAARPRVKSTAITLEEVKRSRANILFFGNFARLTEDHYLQGMTELLRNTDLAYQNMMRDTYGLGRVLIKKYQLLRVSYTIFMIALVSGVLSFVWVLFEFQGTSVGL